MSEKYSMFEPKSSRRLSTDYPELKENSHIKNLSAKEQKLCWYLGCEVSPVYDEYGSKDKKIRQKAIDFAVDKTFNKPLDAQIAKDLKKELPADINRGIEEFEKYNVSIRVRSKKMLGTIADNLEKIIDVDVDGEQFFEVDKDGKSTGRKDFDALSKYVNMALSISKNINDIVHQAENGYSVTLVEEEDVKVIEEGVSIIDFIHENDK